MIQQETGATCLEHILIAMNIVNHEHTQQLLGIT